MNENKRNTTVDLAVQRLITAGKFDDLKSLAEHFRNGKLTAEEGRQALAVCNDPERVQWIEMASGVLMDLVGAKRMIDSCIKKRQCDDLDNNIDWLAHTDGAVNYLMHAYVLKRDISRAIIVTCHDGMTDISQATTLINTLRSSKMLDVAEAHKITLTVEQCSNLIDAVLQDNPDSLEENFWQRLVNNNVDISEILRSKLLENMPLTAGALVKFIRPINRSEIDAMVNAAMQGRQYGLACGLLKVYLEQSEHDTFIDQGMIQYKNQPEMLFRMCEMAREEYVVMDAVVGDMIKYAIDDGDVLSLTIALFSKRELFVFPSDLVFSYKQTYQFFNLFGFGGYEIKGWRRNCNRNLSNDDDEKTLFDFVKEIKSEILIKHYFTFLMEKGWHGQYQCAVKTFRDGGKMTQQEATVFVDNMIQKGRLGYAMDIASEHGMVLSDEQLEKYLSGS